MIVCKGLRQDVEGFVSWLKPAQSDRAMRTEVMTERQEEMLEAFGSLICCTVDSTNPDPVTRSGEPVTAVQRLLKEQGDQIDAVWVSLCS